jgi:hypothetical protein
MQTSCSVRWRSTQGIATGCGFLLVRRLRPVQAGGVVHDEQDLGPEDRDPGAAADPEHELDSNLTRYGLGPEDQDPHAAADPKHVQDSNLTRFGLGPEDQDPDAAADPGHAADSDLGRFGLGPEDR